MVKKTNSFLITFEGIDGCGKSTLARSLYLLIKEDYNALLTQQPGGTSLGLKIRQLLNNRTQEYSPIAEYLLFAADRAQHIAEVIQPALKKGTIVLCDRFTDSSLAYQGYGRGLPKEIIKEINTWTTGETEPDIVFYLRVPYQESRRRQKIRNETLTDFEKEEEGYFQRVIAGFEEMFAQRPHTIILDGLLSPEELCQEAYALFKRLYLSGEKK